MFFIRLLGCRYVGAPVVIAAAPAGVVVCLWAQYKKGVHWVEGRRWVGLRVQRFAGRVVAVVACARALTVLCAELGEVALPPCRLVGI